jgi:hypothetical protein
MRALILSDVAATSTELKVPIWDAMLSLERDSTLGVAKDKQAERDVIHKYRHKLYVASLAHHKRLMMTLQY